MEPRPESLICPRCGKLISGYLEECSYCGLANPAGKQRLLGLLGLNQGSLVRLLIGTNILFFGLSYLLPVLLPSLPTQGGRGFMGLLPGPSSASLALLGWADPRAIWAGQYHLLLTAVFLHGGFLHIIFNMLWVRDLGSQAEAILGPRLMVLVFLLSGALGNLLAVFWPAVAISLGMDDHFAPVVGASGAVFGLMGAIMAYAPKLGHYAASSLARQMGRWALVLVLLGFLIPGVSNTAHIGGFIGGWLLGKLIPLRMSLTARVLLEGGGLLMLLLTGASFLYQFTQAARFLGLI
ncbi:MAG: rhomboid family intramembrane serine protease [bacterium]|nr:rhomboid family intramembrane serine protease [bacterium]